MLRAEFFLLAAALALPAAGFAASTKNDANDEKTALEDAQKIRELRYVRKDLRMTAVRYLGERQVYTAMPQLIKVMQKDTQADVRALAAWSLGECCILRAALPLAQAAIQDASADVRANALWTLHYLQGARQDIVESVVPSVRWSALHEADETARHRAVTVLGMLNPPGINTTLQKVFDRETSVATRAEIASILGRTGGIRGRKTLEKAAQDPYEMVVMAANDSIMKLRRVVTPTAADADVPDEKPVFDKPAPKKPVVVKKPRPAPKPAKFDDIDPELAEEKPAAAKPDSLTEAGLPPAAEQQQTSIQ